MQEDIKQHDKMVMNHAQNQAINTLCVIRDRFRGLRNVELDEWTNWEKQSFRDAKIQIFISKVKSFSVIQAYFVIL